MSGGCAPSPRRADRGSVSLLVVILLPALVLAAGLVLDGGRQLQTRRAAQGAAQAAARAAVQGSDDEVLAGQLDPDRAIARARAELAARGAVGSATLSDGIVVVTVEDHVDYSILPGGASISETASAVARDGIAG